jgi:glycosyltransferase involved in cell wall biosynthesis
VDNPVERHREDHTLRTAIATVSVLRSQPGAAAARNAGYRSARHDWILFLDDDVQIRSPFLAFARDLVDKSLPGVMTLRVKDARSTATPLPLAAIISLDRGTDSRSAPRPLPLQDVWMYGVGAAMMVHRSVMAATGGFKVHLGAGRWHGGAEDLEFLWHAARHTSIKYHADLTVEHPQPPTARATFLKIVEYGRAIGHLAGIAKGQATWTTVVNYCKHVEVNTRPGRLRSVDLLGAVQARSWSLFAITETAYAFALARLISSRWGVLCSGCMQR